MYELLSTLAESYGGTSNRYNQANGLIANWRVLQPDSQEGVCSGLVLMWLSAKKAGITNNIFGGPSNNKYAAPTYLFAERLQQYGADKVRYVNDAAFSLSLLKIGARIMVNNKNFTKWVFEGQGHFKHISLKGHAVGICTGGTVAGPRPFKFFDPNAGEASFPDRLKFYYFLNDYLLYTNNIVTNIQGFN